MGIGSSGGGTFSRANGEWESTGPQGAVLFKSEFSLLFDFQNSESSRGRSSMSDLFNLKFELNFSMSKIFIMIGKKLYA